MLPARAVYTEEHEMFRDAVRGFIKTEIAPHFARWEEQGIVDRWMWDKAGAAGLLCPQVGDAYGGAGGTFRHNAIVAEEFSYAGMAGPQTDISVHNDVCAGYLISLATEEQKQRWLTGMVSGKTVCAIAMTEPGTGSDLQGIKTRAVREGDQFRVNGSKTFISNGQHCDLVILVCRTSDAPGAKGISLLLVDTTSPGFRRGRNLDKIGLHGNDTAELFFDEVRVPVENCLAGEGEGWNVAMATAGFERGLMLRAPGRFQATATRLVELFRQHEKTAAPAVREAVLTAWMGTQAYAYNTYAVAAKIMAGGKIVRSGGPELALELEETGYDFLKELATA